MRYREVTAVDHEQIAQKYIETFAKAPWNETHEFETILMYIKRLAAMNTFMGLIVETSDTHTFLGVALGYIKPWYQGEEYVLDTFFIDPSHQSQHIGTRFMEHLKIVLASREIPAIMLDTDRDTPAEKFYQKHGFSASEDTVLMFGNTKN
ncbi:GNAT family N-acetyltransferase [Enterococcus bulliens]